MSIVHVDNDNVKFCKTIMGVIRVISIFTHDYYSLSDETKKFLRDRYRDFFSRPKILRPRPRLFSRSNIFETDTDTFFRDQMFLRPIPRLFFETKYFRDRYRDFFSRPNVFETDTETFFETKCFRDRYRDFFETKFFRD